MMTKESKNFKESTIEIKKYLDEFASREKKGFSTIQKIYDKVSPEGTFKIFYGDTSVFKFDNIAIEKCKKLQEKIFDKYGEYFVVLDPETYHITVTSFNNPYTVLYGGEASINKEVEKIRPVVEDVFKEIKNIYSGKILKFNLAKITFEEAIGLRMIPSDEESAEILYDIRKKLDSLNGEKKREINFYVPHVSLGYFNYKEKSTDLLEEMQQYCNALSIEEKIEIEVEVDKLTYQYHHHMNDFRDIISIENM